MGPLVKVLQLSKPRCGFLPPHPPRPQHQAFLRGPLPHHSAFEKKEMGHWVLSTVRSTMRSCEQRHLWRQKKSGGDVGQAPDNHLPRTQDFPYLCSQQSQNPRWLGEEALLCLPQLFCHGPSQHAVTSWGSTHHGSKRPHELLGVVKLRFFVLSLCPSNPFPPTTDVGPFWTSAS